MKRLILRLSTRVLFPAATVLAVYLLLQALAGRRLFPALPVVAGRFAALVTNGKLPYHALVSARRIAAGLVLSVLAAVPSAALLARFPRVDRFLSPLLFLAFPSRKSPSFQCSCCFWDSETPRR
jgi:NitT/TauT family transport system permease protein